MMHAEFSEKIVGVAFVSVILVLARAASAQPPPAPVVVAPVVEQEVASGQISVGTIMPSKHAVIGSAVDGRVVEFLVNEGDRVEKGQPLARLLTETIRLELAGAQAVLRLRQAEVQELNNGSRPEEIARANAQLLRAIAKSEYAKSQRVRAVRLFTDKITSEAEHDEAVAEAAAAEQTVREAKATYDLAMQGPRTEKIAQANARVDVQHVLVKRLQDQITKHTIISRFDGFVIAEHTEEGAWLNSGDPVVEVAALDQVEVQTYVIEKHVPHIEIGSTVRVEIPALENRLFMGRVARIVPQADVRSRTFPVKVHVENVVKNSSPLLKAGMYARMTLPTGAPQKMTLVPKDALVLGGPQPVVFVVDVANQDKRQGTVRAVPVEVGVATGHSIQVIGELTEGQLVVVEGNERLRPAQMVRMTRVLEPDPIFVSEKSD